ncbi:MAG: DUF2807 domain-containing protein [Lachnospiraceae bacterium]|nr:DUF2807 domain-containing protein [Lachnospiraceae bacterium]
MKRFFCIIMLAALLALAACSAVRKETAVNGAVTVKKVEGEAASLEIKNVVLKQGLSTMGPQVLLGRDGKGSRVELEGPSDLLEEIRVEFSGKRLKVSADAAKLYVVSSPVIIRIYDMELEALALSGACDAEAEDGALARDKSGTELDIRLSGASALKTDRLSAGEIVMDLSGASSLTAGVLECDKWKLDLSGASSLTAPVCQVSGLADWHMSGASRLTVGENAADVPASRGGEIFVVLSGASLADASEFEVGKATLTLSGGSTLECWVTGVLGGSITGSSAVYYKGMPTLATHTGASSTLQQK